MSQTAFDGRVVLVDHPLVQHKLSLLRDEGTSSGQFRRLVRELALIEGCEATADLPLKDVDVRTPLATAHCKRLAHKSPVIVPILRAGLGMVEGLLEILPDAQVGHLGMYRDEASHKPVAYYEKLPRDIAEVPVIVVDPMLATGGSMTAALEHLRARGVEGPITAMVLVSAPEGIQAVLAADAEVRIFSCAVDDGLNEDAYILPGLGDAGDRIFGTENE